MFACTELKEELSAYIDGELEAGKQSQITEHLGQCADCQGAHTEMRSTVSVIAQGKLATFAKCPDIWSAMQSKLPSVCETIEEDFSAYLDGELIVPAKEGVSEHLGACTPCHEKFQNLSQVNGLLSRGLEMPENVEINLWASIRNRLDEDCQLIRDELSSFYDREVTPPRHRAITSHLLECSECRDQLALITQTGELLRANYQPDFPEGFDLWPEIKAKMAVVPFAPKEKRRKDFMHRRMYGVAAAVVAGVLATISFFVNVHSASTIQPVTAESYLIESALGEPTDVAEAMAYENP